MSRARVPAVVVVVSLRHEADARLRRSLIVVCYEAIEPVDLGIVA